MASPIPTSSCNGSSSTYIRSQYNLNPPPPVLLAGASPSSSGLVGVGVVSPDDLPPPGYKPSAPSESAPSTIEDYLPTTLQMCVECGVCVFRLLDVSTTLARSTEDGCSTSKVSSFVTMVRPLSFYMS